MRTTLGMHEINTGIAKKGTAISQNVVRTSLMALGISFKKTEYGDYRVNLLRGKEATAYYTDDLVDALATGRLMAAAEKEVKDAQNGRR